MTSTNELFEGLLAGERTALGRAITLVESSRPQDRTHALELVERARRQARAGLRLGVTGIPGVGKSTLIDVLGMHWVEQGHRVAVLAVDPSSARSGGSILGDKTRMERLGQHPAAFIRPSPTGGTLGGVTRRTRETILLCEAAGYDRVLVETVGIGQNELDVDRMTDLNLLLMIAGAGDELQGIKRGIMETADLIAFTKADGPGAERAQLARRELRNAIALLPPRDSGRHPDVLLTSALDHTGIDALAAHITQLHQQDLASGRVQRRRHEQDVQWMSEAASDLLLERFHRDAAVTRAWAELERQVREGRSSPLEAAARAVDLFRTGGAPLP